jgi:hypothetical protein
MLFRTAHDIYDDINIFRYTEEYAANNSCFLKAQ